MSESAEDSWAAHGIEIPTSERVLSAERQLALVDRILGLEARLAERSVVTTLTPTEQLRTEQQLAKLQASLAWRVGRAATAPMRAGRSAFRRVTRP
jgi:hypothetical protein